MPHSNGKEARLHIRLRGNGLDSRGFAQMGKHNCCGTRKFIDPSIDGYKDEIQDVWHGYHRDVRCIINGWNLCPQATT